MVEEVRVSLLALRADEIVKEFNARADQIGVSAAVRELAQALAAEEARHDELKRRWKKDATAVGNLHHAENLATSYLLGRVLMPDPALRVSPVYYFGCWNHAGHFLHDPSGRSLSREAVGPFDVYGKTGMPIDGKFTPGPHPQYGPSGGLQDDTFVALTYVRGWTVVAMWDNSIDSRPGSNAAFIAEGRLTEADMWALARQHYPQIVARLKAAPKEIANHA